MKIATRVKPGAARARVGGEGSEGELVIAVTERAVDGQATEAARKALARALGVAPSRVRLARGARSKIKLWEVDCEPGEIPARAAALRRQDLTGKPGGVAGSGESCAPA
ncbi:MAG: DUF167 domain-containing protein [Candidatus Nanopelagicales bacterium]|nr:DUF167 domain-containing protein [Candidatus Nanopelagicales bacterium]